jgi:putative ubiquitin-RnfH superfamily antitoxin RatB of RatAB toxin-antitoxin module
MRIEVAYAEPQEQFLLALEVEEGTSALDAILQSKVLERFPNIDLARNAIGIFGKVCKPEQILRPGDRVEIYRPLATDPKEARRLRAMDKHPKKI